MTAGDDTGEVFKAVETTGSDGTQTVTWRQTTVSLCGTAAINPVLAAPTFLSRNVTFTVTSAGTINAFLQWSGGLGVGWDIRYRQKGVSAWTRVPRIITFTSRNQSISGLAANKDYEFEVAAVGADGSNSTWARVNKRTSGLPLALPPLAIQAEESQVFDGNVNIDWTNRTDWRQVSRLRVRLRRPGYTQAVAQKYVSATSTSTYFTNVPTGSYYVQIAAENPQGIGNDGSSARFLVTRNAPAPPPRREEYVHLPYEVVSVTAAFTDHRTIRVTIDASRVKPNGAPTGFEYKLTPVRNGQVQFSDPWRRLFNGFPATGRNAITANIGFILGEAVDSICVRAVNSAGSSGRRCFTTRINRPSG